MTNDVSVPVLRNDGDSLKERMTENAYEDILPARYLRKDEEGNIIEEQEEVFERVAKNIAVAEAVYEGDLGVSEKEAPEYSYDDVNRVRAVQEWADKFQHYMEHLKFIPNTPTLINAGTDMQQLSACFVDSPEDDIKDIGDTETEAKLIFQCLTEETIVETRDGRKNISEVETGDKILQRTDEGVEFADVENVFVYDNAPTSVVTLKSGQEIVGTPNHELLVNDEWKEIQDIKEDDNLHIPLDYNITDTKQPQLEQVRSGPLWEAEADVEEIINLHSQGYNDYEIAEEIESSPSTVQKWRSDKLDLEPNGHGGVRKGQLVTFNEDKALKLYEDGMSDSQIAEKLECSKSAIRSFRERNSLKRNKTAYKQVNQPEKLSWSLSQILGFWIGDGSFHKDGVRFHVSRDEVKEEIESVSNDLFNVEPHSTWSDGCYDVVIHSHEIKRWWKENFGQCKRSSPEASVPDVVFNSGEKEIFAFVRGLFTADGSLNNSMYPTLTTLSEQLARDVQSLLIRVGIPAKTSTHTETENNFVDGEVKKYFVAPTTQQGLRLYARKIGWVDTKRDLENIKSVKANNFRKGQHGYINEESEWVVPVESVRNGEKSSVYDVSVEGKSEYIANDVVSHNSGGGVGYDFGKLRPYGDAVGSTGGIASGPITFMQNYDQSCETIAQGGCVVGDTRVMTEEGYKKISDIHNDTPLNSNGEPLDVAVQTRSGDYHSVKKTSDSGTMEVFEVETEGGYTVRGSFDHPVLTVRGGELEYVEIGDIADDDVVVMNQSKSLRDVYALLDDISKDRHFNESEISTPDVLNENVAFFLGVLWGDGTFDRGVEDRIVFSIGKSEREKPIKERLETILTGWGVNYCVTDQNEKKCHGNYWRIEINSKALTDWLKKNNLDKRIDIIPEKLYHSPASIPDFLAGMVCDATYASDGGVVRYTTISEDFAENLQDLLMLCGVPSKIYSDTEREGAYGDNEIFMVETRPGPSTETFDEIIPHPFDKELSKGGERQNQVPDTDAVVEDILSQNFEKGCKFPENVDEKSMKELRRYERGERTPSRQRLVNLFEDINVDCPEVLDEDYWFEPVSSVKSAGYEYVYDIEMLHDAHEFVGDNFCVHNVRRGAQMGTMSVTHPDIIHFIHAKNKDVSLAHQLRLNDPDDPTYSDFGEAIEEARDVIDEEGRVPEHLRNAVEGHLSNFNISVTIPDEFMEAVENEEEYTLINPRTEEPHIATQETKNMYSWFGLGDEVTVGEELTLPAEEIWTRIVEGAYENGEPGVIYLDTVNEEHSYDVQKHPQYKQTTTNPCVAEGTLVNTPEGYRRVEEIEEGDEINTVYGSEEVNEVLEFEDRQVYEVTFSDGGKQIVTEDHRYHALKQEGSYTKRIDDVPLRELSEGDSVRLLPDMSSFEEGGDYERGLKRGILLGDGCYTEKTLSVQNNLSISSNIDDKEYNENLKSLFETSRKLDDNGRNKSVKVWVDDAEEVIDELDLKPSKSHNKNFDIESVTEKEEAVGILDGLMASDGNINLASNHPQARWFTSSEELAQNIRRLLIGLGMNGRISVEEAYQKSNGSIDGRDIERNHDLYTVHISGESLRKYLELTQIDDIHPEKGKRADEIKKEFMCTGNTWKAKIESIEPAGSSDVYDLYCEGSDTWVTDGYVQRGCAEQPLMEYEACNLGHINLSTIAEEDAYTWDEVEDVENLEFDVENFLEQAIDWEEFNQRISVGTRFLDNVVTMSDFPIEEIEETVRKNRKIGLGIMGLAQLYIQLGVEYGSPEANEIARQLMTHINHVSKSVSHELAEERGTFENWNDSKYSSPESYPRWFRSHTGREPEKWSAGFPVRNHNTTTIAPTGTTSMIGNTTGGCEPIYNVAFYKNVTDDVQGDEMLVEFDNLFLKTLEENDIDVEEVKDYAEKLMANNEFDGVDDLVPEIPQEIADLFVTTSDLDSKEHAGVLCDLQEGVDSSISKTLNAPYEATVEDAKETFEYVYKNGGKSVTFYRDGTRTKQVKTTRKDNQEVDDENGEKSISELLADATEMTVEDIESLTETENSENKGFSTVRPRNRPKNTEGETKKVDTPQGTLYVTINEDEHGPVEVFATVGKSGSTMESFTEALARQVSLSLRAGVHIDNIIEQLQNIRASEVAWDSGETVYSVPDGIATALKRYRNNDEEEEEMQIDHHTTVPSNYEGNSTGEECPECGEGLIMKEGCKECPDPSCPWSKC